VNFWGFDETDFMKQQAVLDVLQKSREKGGIEIHAARIYHSDTQAYTYLPGSTSFYQYMAKFVTLTAGTYQDRTNCGLCSWLDMHFSFKTKLAEKPVVSVPNIRVKVGQSTNLVAKDISGGVIPAALKRSNGVSYSWFTDCAAKGTNTLNGQTVTFTPTKAGTCHGAVVVRESAKAFCNSCTEGDPYGSRAVTPFVIEVLPADYTPPPLPGLIRNITKEHLWSEDALRIKWDPPANATDVGELAYVVRDEDGTVLGVTRSTQLDITDIEDEEEPIVLVSGVSSGGFGGLTSIEDAEDVSQAKPEPEVPVQPGDVLGTSTAKTDMQQVLSTAELIASPNSSASVSFRQITTPAQSPVMFAPGTDGIASVISQGVIHNMNQAVNAPTWLKLTIMAIPVITAIGLGLTLKYALSLRAKRF
jgi:hypothetical protein